MVLGQGGEVVVVTALNLGPRIEKVSAVYGSRGRLFDARSCSFVASTPPEQRVSCLTSAGVGSDLRWRVDAGGQSSPWFVVPGGASANESASRYASPSILSVTPSVPRLSTRGGQMVRIVGANFGAAGQDAFANVTVRYGRAPSYRFSAVSCRVDPSQPHTAVLCLSASGVGSGHAWVVSVGEQASAPSDNTTTYVGPTLHRVTGQGTLNAKTEGGQTVTLVGDELGSVIDAAGLVTVTYGPAPLLARFTATSCRVTVDFNTISCLTAAGSGSGHSWTVVVDELASEPLHANTSYGAPIVAAYSGTGTVGGDVACVNGEEECGVTQGNQTVFISGQNFGPSDVGNSVFVTYGASGTEVRAHNCSVVVSHTRLACLTSEGAGAGLKWSVTIDGLASVAPTTAYSGPHVLSIEGAAPTAASPYGGEMLRIRGTNFGPSLSKELYPTTVVYGVRANAAERCAVLSHAVIECLTVPGVGVRHAVTVTVAGQSSNSDLYLSYAPPEIVDWDAANFTFDTGGGRQVVIGAVNVGASVVGVDIDVVLVGLDGVNSSLPVAATVTPGGVRSRGVDGAVVQNPDQVQFVMPPGRGRGRELFVRAVDTSFPSSWGVSNRIRVDFRDPVLAGLSASVQTSESLLCDGVKVATVGVDGSATFNEVFVVTLNGFNFGDAAPGGRRPADSASSSVHVHMLVFGDVPFEIPCFESWSSTRVKFAVKHPGSVWLEVSSTGVDGAVYSQTTAPLEIRVDSPTVSNLNVAGPGLSPRDQVPTNGTGKVRIVGKQLFADGVRTVVTIGGLTGGACLRARRRTGCWLLVPAAPCAWSCWCCCHRL